MKLITLAPRGASLVEGCQFSKKCFFRNLRKSRFTYTKVLFTSARVDLKCPYQTKSALRIPTSAQSDVDYPPTGTNRLVLHWSENTPTLRARFDSDQETQLSQVTSEERHEWSPWIIKQLLYQSSPSPSPSQKALTINEKQA